MNGGKSHRGVERLVLERKAFRGGSHAPRCAREPLRTHDRRRLHRGHLTVGGFIGAGAGPDIKHSPRIAERSPDLRGDPRLGAPRHRVAGSDGVIQLLAGHDTAFPAITTAPHSQRVCLRRRPRRVASVAFTVAGGGRVTVFSIGDITVRLADGDGRAGWVTRTPRR
jgi:hypothetical protein